MGVMREVLGNAGAKHTLRHNDKVYGVSLIDQRVKDAFEQGLFDRAMSALEGAKRVLAPEEYRARLDGLLEAFEAGEYEMLSPRGLKHLNTPSGLHLLLSLLIDCDPSELFGLVLAKSAEIAALVGLIVRESFPGVELTLPKGEGERSAPDGAADPN